MPWRCAAFEDLDDDHAAAAAWTGRLARIVGGSGGPVFFGICNGEQLTRAGNAIGAIALGEEAVVADAMQAFWQHVDEEASDELVGSQRHLLVPIVALDAVVLPLEGNALLVEGDQAAVGDGNAVGVTRQIGQHGLRSAERTLCVDDAFGLAQRGEISRKGLRLDEMSVVAEEVEAVALMGGR